MTIDVLTYGETMGVFESERTGPLRVGGSMRQSMAGAESTVAIGVSRLGGSAAWVGVACPGDWEGLPTRAEIEMLRGDDGDDVLR